MKKFLAILLLVVMIITTFSACSKAGTASDNSTDVNVNAEVDANEDIADSSDEDVASTDSQASEGDTDSNAASEDKNASVNDKGSANASSTNKDSSSNASKVSSADTNKNNSSNTGKNSSTNASSGNKDSSSNTGKDNASNTSKNPSANASTTNSGANNSSGASKNPSSNANSTTTNSKDNNSTQNSSANNQNTSSSTADSLRGKTVTIASWEDFNGTERANVMQKFTKETGIKVKVVPVTQNDYIVKMASRLSAGKSVDIFIDNQEFPRTLSFAQPITNAGIDLKDAKWDQTIINTSTINGKTYLINAKWDLKYFVLSYNKSLFEGITSPEDYVKNNNWTWETFAKAAKDISNLGSEYVGAHFSTPIFMAAYGASYVKYDSTKQEFYRSTDEKQFADVWTYILDGQKEGYLNPTYNSAKLVAGTCGMSINDVFALQKDGYYASMKVSDWGFTYLPKKSASDPDYPKASLMFAYGLMKGAPNPEAAGVFLNYYLDEKNWNFDNYYANSAAKDFANILNKRTPESTDYMFICKGPLAITYTYGYSEIDKIFLQLTSKQVNQGVNRSANKIDNAVKKANDMIKAVG